MKKLKVLNLYAGIGGNRKLWEDVEVTAVEWDQETAKVYQDYFPDDKMVVGDAHQYLLDHYKDLILYGVHRLARHTQGPGFGGGKISAPYIQT